MNRAASTALRRLKTRADWLESARVERDVALIEGHAAGLTLRDLASASGLGVETVRRVLRAEGVTT